MELENVKLKEQLAENAKEITALKTSESTIITLKQRLTKYEAKVWLHTFFYSLSITAGWHGSRKGER